MATNYQYTFSDKQITAMWMDSNNMLLWIGIKTATACKLLAVSPFNLNDTYYELDVEAIGINAIASTGPYIVLALEGSDYIGMYVDTGNPLALNGYFEFPAGIVEDAVDVRFGSAITFLTPGVASGVNAHLIRFHATAFIQVGDYELDTGLSNSIPVRNAWAFDIDSSDQAWICTANSPAEIVYVPDTYDSYTITELSTTANACENLVDVVISGTDLYAVSDEIVPQIVKADISTTTPAAVTYPLNQSNEQYESPTAIAVNNTFGFGYVASAAGLICKFALATPTTREESNVADTNNLVDVTTFDDFDMVYVATDASAAGEAYRIDPAVTKTSNLFISCLLAVETVVGLVISWVRGKVCNLDLRVFGWSKAVTSLDIRCLTQNYTAYQPLGLSNAIITLDGVDISSEVLMNSIQVSWVADSDITATFRLPRRFDSPDYTLTGTYRQISNQNAVVITLAGRKIFDGKVVTFTGSLSDESLTVECSTTEDITNYYNMSTAPLHLAGLTERKHPLQVLEVNSVTINNPVVNAEDENPEVYKGIEVDLGVEEREILYRRINLTHFVRDDYAGNVSQVLGYDGNLAQSVNAFSDHVVTASAPYPDYNKFALSDFVPQQNYTYFWYVGSAVNLITGRHIVGKYIGTSLGSLTNEIIDIDIVHHHHQRILDNTRRELGVYQVGEAPFRTITTKNGRYLQSSRWEDRDNGLYFVTPEHYDYVSYAKKVAELEYQKMLNINGDLLPKTSASIVVSWDTFIAQNLNLLTRINITNTTQAGVYENSNGFPLSIKSLTINFETAVVELNCDNQKSEYELDQINQQFPVEPEPTPERAIWMARKFDIATGKYVA